MNDVNPLYDPATDDAHIDEDVQERLNQPQADPTGFDPEDEAFLNDVMAKFESGQIQTHSPSSLLNELIYNKLDDAKKGKADQNAFNILSALRRIYDLWKMDQTVTFQIKNEIHSIRLTKENLEDELGDVYIV